MQNYSSLCLPRYAVCRTVSPGVITLWNIVKSKCKCKAVRVERGLTEATDVVLVRDMKLFVLTDKGMASFADPPRPIFQVPTVGLSIIGIKPEAKKKANVYVCICYS